MGWRPQITIRSACKAPACFRASRIAIRSLGAAPTVHRTHDLVQGGARAELEHWLGFLLGIDLRARHYSGLAIGERSRLADDRVFGDGHGQAAVGDRRRRDLDVLADDDGAGTRVDDDLGHGLARVDLRFSGIDR